MYVHMLQANEEKWQNAGVLDNEAITDNWDRC